MKLSNLTADYPCEMSAADPEITGLSYDSRLVRSGDLFFCVKGFQSDGHRYAQEAVRKGASALVVTHPLPLDIPQVVVQNDRQAMSLFSQRFFDNPAKKMRMIGITGTNGKTSITYMLKAIFERMGEKVGLIGTIVNMIGNEPVHTERTTPESVDLQALLARMYQEGVQTVIMEVSSHSLALERVYGIEFDGAVFTNLTQDHLDFHGSMENYAAAKRILFENARVSSINADDSHAQYMKAAAKGTAATYGIQNKADLMARDVQLSPEGSRFVLAAYAFRLPLLLQIPGLFSVYNALAAASVCLSMGIDMLPIKQGLESLTNVPGRFERLDTQGRDFTVILDYAHTPDSLQSTLTTVRGFAQGRIVCLFGCGGNRDNLKRPIMGEIAERLADFVIVTSDNPRCEEPAEIISQILAGMEKTNHITIENRREAIYYALKNARSADVIVLAGKGHEDYQEIDHVKHPFDEKVIVREILQELDEI